MLGDAVITMQELKMLIKNNQLGLFGLAVFILLHFAQCGLLEKEDKDKKDKTEEEAKDPNLKGKDSTKPEATTAAWKTYNSIVKNSSNLLNCKDYSELTEQLILSITPADLSESESWKLGEECPTEKIYNSCLEVTHEEGYKLAIHYYQPLSASKLEELQKECVELEGEWKVVKEVQEEEEEEAKAEYSIKEPTFTIEEGEYTTTRSITLKIVLDAEDDKEYKVYISETENFMAEDATDYKKSIPWTLSQTEGQKTIYVQLEDEKGQISKIITASILLDTIKPTAPIIENSDRRVTANKEAITILADSEDANFSHYEAMGGQYTTWTKVSAPISFDLATDNEWYTLQLKAFDKVEQVSDIVKVNLYRGEKTILIDNEEKMPNYSATSTTLTKVFSPYFIKTSDPSNLYFTTRSNMVIEPGVTLVFDDDMTIAFSGGLHVAGNKDNHVKFTSSKSTPAAGDWKGFYFPTTNHNDATITYLDVEYFSQVQFTGTSTITVRDSTFSDISTKGIYIGEKQILNMSYTDITCNDTSVAEGIRLMHDISKPFEASYLDIKNCKYGVFSMDQTVAQISNSNFSSNTTNLHLQTSNGTHTLQDNYWDYDNGSGAATYGDIETKLGISSQSENFTWSPYFTSAVASAGQR